MLSSDQNSNLPQAVSMIGRAKDSDFSFGVCTLNRSQNPSNLYTFMDYVTYWSMRRAVIWLRNGTPPLAGCP